MSIAAPEQELLLRTDDGVALAARIWRPAAPSGTGVVVVHGFTASRDHADVVAVAEQLCRDGHHVIGFDARGHGGSEGHCSLGNDEHHDVAAAVEALRGEVDRMVVVGASMGAVATLRYAARSPGLHGVVTVSAPARWRLPRTARGALAALLTRTRPGRHVVTRHLKVRIAPRWHRSASPDELAARIEAPVAVVHGRADRFIPPAEAAILYGAVRSPRRLLLVEGMGHAFAPPSVPVISDAVRWTLMPPG